MWCRVNPIKAEIIDTFAALKTLNKKVLIIYIRDFPEWADDFKRIYKERNRRLKKRSKILEPH